MRPINLIPSDQRRGEHAPMRSGPLAYAIVGLLCVALAGITALVLTNNKVSDRKADVAELKVEEQEVKARVERLQGYVDFATTRQARVATVSSLADSRFDWERVMRELSRVLPSDVWLINLTASAQPGVELEDGAGLQTRGSVTGPALEMVGCGTSQESVARLIAALRDIDGVTRVGVTSSKLPELSDSSGLSSSSEGSDDDCRTREFIAKFEIVVAFDEVPPPGTPSPEPAPSGSTTPTEPVSNDSSGVAETRQQEVAARNSTEKQTQKAKDSVDLIPGS